jgi:hypothetical protein
MTAGSYLSVTAGGGGALRGLHLAAGEAGLRGLRLGCACVLAGPAALWFGPSEAGWAARL